MGGGSGVGIGGGFIDQNKEALGVLFKPDPVTGVIAPNPEKVNGPGSPNNKDADYHPYGSTYGTNAINVPTHVGYSNYNGFQIVWQKRSSHLNYNLNYTRSKSLGTGLQIDPFSVRGNYGVSNTDRPNVINTSFSYNLLNTYHGANKLIAGSINNWMVSAITTWQGGGNLQALASPNFSMSLSYNGTQPPGVDPGYGTPTYYGTNAANLAIMPVLTCNPGSGLASKQHVTDKCFAPPPIGTYGPRNFPYLSGPSYFNSDLALSKLFHITEKNAVTFRASASDWLNHPLDAYSGQQLNLYYNTAYSSKASTLSSQTSSTFGTTNTKAGGDTRRIIELSLKYSF
jgi:hypothetical protein